VALGLPAFRDADDFNARVMASHRLVGAEALLDDWVIAIVAGNTFGHYEEHAKEVGLE
jgi:hypothetical protein